MTDFNLPIMPSSPFSYKTLAAGRFKEFLQILAAESVHLPDDFLGVDLDESKWIPIDGGEYGKEPFEIGGDSNGILRMNPSSWCAIVGAPIWQGSQHCFMEAKFTVNDYSMGVVEVGFVEAAQAHSAKMSKVGGDGRCSTALGVASGDIRSNLEEFAGFGTYSGQFYATAVVGGTVTATATTVSPAVGVTTVIQVSIIEDDIRLRINGVPIESAATSATSKTGMFAPWIGVHAPARMELDRVRVWAGRKE